ncbi:energy-coupled thiamine transporter ThiT [Dolosicoccus paucivorans]|nr:energy-coupled thiamine transporter ThiT [Dolosicoccus paucivorans]SDI61319.1 thiamine transporter [Dolosicoccus paucivorans]
MNKRLQPTVMMEIALLAALSMLIDFIDSAFRIGPWSFSFSMVPILILAIRRGPKAGFMGGFLWALLQFVTGDAHGFVHPVQMILDYPLAFTVLGLAGYAYRNRTLPNILKWSLIGIFARYVCHWLSGWIFFGMYAPEGQPAWLYSLIVNGNVFLINTVVCLIILALLYYSSKDRLFIPKS